MNTINEARTEDYTLQLVAPELLEKLTSLAERDLTWLSGYCAGLAKTRANDVLNSPVVVPVLDTTVLLLYASQSGNSQRIAESLQRQLSEKSITADLRSCDEIKLKHLKDYSILLMIASTHGEGEAPDSSLDFLELIQSKKAPDLKHLHHAVLALGDSSYEYFCQTGKEFEQAFVHLNSSSLLQRMDCDIDFEDEAEQWSADITAKLMTLDIISSNDQHSKTALQNHASASIHPINTYDKKNPYLAEVLAIQKITAKGSIKETYHIELALENSGIQYSPGDSLGIIAVNSCPLVTEIIKYAQLDQTTEVSFQGESYPLATLLTNKLEITQLNKALLTKYNAIANNALLQTIIDDQPQSYILDHQLLDLFIDFPIEITAQQLVDLLPRLKPRLYSIASSQSESEDEVHLTVNAKSNINKNGIRQGLASNYLIHQLKDEQKVSIYVDTNPNFRLPAADKNIILIGPGTGIAPFRAFLQHREVTAASGKNWLLFGNPNFNSDFLYQSEMKHFLDTGVLNKLDLAFSRDQQQKIYVQDKLLENSKQVWQWLEQGAYLYVCGDINRMAKDVESAILTIIQDEADKTLEQAKNYLSALRKDKRYQRDVY